MSKRLHCLETFDLEGVGPDRQAIFNALVSCLTAKEACQALDLRLGQPYRKRQALIRHIQTQMRRGLVPRHTAMLSALEQGITDLPAPKRKSAANVLLRLAEALPPDCEHEVLQRLSQSPDATVRGQVYRRVKELPDSLCPDYVVAALQTFRDFEAARIVVTRGSRDALAANFTALESVLASSGYLLARLFLQLSGQPPADLARLKQMDAVSHAYVCAKLGVVLPSEEMVALYRASIFKERSGLVAWCCGQMGHWEALIEMLSIAENPPDDALLRPESKLLESQLAHSC